MAQENFDWEEYKVPPLVDLKTLQEYHEYLNAKKLSGIGGKRKNTKRIKRK